MAMWPIEEVPAGAACGASQISAGMKGSIRRAAGGSTSKRALRSACRCLQEHAAARYRGDQMVVCEA